MKRATAVGTVIVLLLACAAVLAEPLSGNRYILVIRLDLPATPLSEKFVGSQITVAERDNAALVILDATAAGGFSSSVSGIANLIRAARIPVFVLPQSEGSSLNPALRYLADAGSPIPSPVPSSAEALISSLDDASVSFRGRPVTLHTVGLPVRTAEMNGIARLLARLLDPTLAYVLLVIGIIGIAIEFSVPGIGLPGVLGGLSLLVSLVALGAFSVNVGGLLIILLSLVLFVVDIKAPTHGILTAGGIVALLAGSFLLFPAREALPGLNPVRISPIAIALVTAVLSGAALTAVVVGARARHRRVAVGPETLVGLSGTAVTGLNLDGIVRVANEEWSASSAGEEIKAGEEVDVVGVKGVRLIIIRRI